MDLETPNLGIANLGIANLRIAGTPARNDLAEQLITGRGSDQMFSRVILSPKLRKVCVLLH